MSIFSSDFDASRVGLSLKARIEQRKQPEVEMPDTTLRALKVAALSRLFWPNRPLLGDVGAAPAREVVLSFSIVGAGANSPWQLTPRSRDWALANIADAAEVVTLIERHSPEVTPAQRRAMLEFARGQRSAVHDQSSDELQASRFAVERLQKIGSPPELPDLDAISARLYARQTFAALERLIANGVVGREVELDKLRRFVGLLDARSLFTLGLDDVRRSLRGLFSQDRQLPLLVHGPGGIGKSTVLAQFVAEHAQFADEAKFPLCYLDFERPTLSPRDPFSLLEEIARQLRFQYPSETQAFDAFGAQLVGARGPRPKSATSEKLTPKEQIAAELARFRRVRPVLGALNDLVTRLTNRASASRRGGESLPFVIILDSFEEAQQRSIDAVAQLWELFEELQRHCRLLRVIVSGRAPVNIHWRSDREPDTLKITELDTDACTELMVRRGMPEKTARVLGARLGGNPLTLRLAVSLFKRLERNDPNGKWLRDIDSGGWRRFFIDANVFVQGQLYNRILEHVANEEVRRLAHPGLVLRRITTGLIREVLAEPCGLGEIGEEEAEVLFAEFAREVDLVERRSAEEDENDAQEREDALYHRPDVRQIMLRLMEHDKSATVREIERRAVTYYQRSNHPEDRAEEIYHRLRLGEHPRKVAPRWLPEVEKYLDNALPEIPAKAQAFLAVRLEGLQQVDDDVFAAADLADWEHLIANRARYLIETGEYSQALSMIREREERSADSPLYPVEARALIALERKDKAQELIERGLDGTSDAGNQQVRFELLELAAQLALEKGEDASGINYLSARVSLAERDEVSEEHLNALLDLHGAVTVGTTASFDPQAVEAQLIDTVKGVDVQKLHWTNDLAVRVARAVGPRDAPSLRKLLTVQRPVAPSEQVARFGYTLAELMGQDRALTDDVWQTAYDAGYRLDPSKPEAIGSVVSEMANDKKLMTFVNTLLQRHEDDQGLNQAVVDTFFSPAEITLKG